MKAFEGCWPLRDVKRNLNAFMKAGNALITELKHEPGERRSYLKVGLTNYSNFLTFFKS
jgi:hypothetical protein